MPSPVSQQGPTHVGEGAPPSPRQGITSPQSQQSAEDIQHLHPSSFKYKGFNGKFIDGIEKLVNEKYLRKMQ